MRRVRTGSGPRRRYVRAARAFGLPRAQAAGAVVAPAAGVPPPKWPKPQPPARPAPVGLLPPPGNPPVGLAVGLLPPPGNPPVGLVQLAVLVGLAEPPDEPFEQPATTPTAVSPATEIAATLSPNALRIRTSSCIPDLAVVGLLTFAHPGAQE